MKNDFCCPGKIRTFQIVDDVTGLEPVLQIPKICVVTITLHINLYYKDKQLISYNQMN